MSDAFPGGGIPKTAYLRPWQGMAGEVRRTAFAMVTLVGLAVVLLAVIVTGGVPGGSSLPEQENEFGYDGLSRLGGDDQPVAEETTDTITTASTLTTATDPYSAARAVDTLLQEANRGRQAVTDAVVDIRGCGNVLSDVAVLDQAVTDRQSLATRVEQVDVSQLSGGAEAVTLIASAWRSSAEADNYLAAWGRDVSGCTSPPGKGNANREAGDAASHQASSQKEDFVALWNPIAFQYDLTRWRAGDL